MKLIILKKNLTEAISTVERSIGGASSLPILKNILIKTEKGIISLTTTNLEVAATHIVPGKVIEVGGIAVPAGLLGSIVKNLTSERITLETSTDTSLLITTDNYEATIQGLAADDFPIIPAVSDKSIITLPVSDFLDAIASVIVATQYSDIRPEISGVYLRYDDGRFVFAATDSFRLAEKTVIGAQLSGDSPNPFIIPLFTAEEILHIFKELDGELSISIEQNQITLTANSKRLTSRLVDGRFPDYHTIIPKDFTREFLVDRQELLGAVRLVSSFSGKTNDLSIISGANKKFIDVVSGSSSVGENHYRVPVKLSGDDFKLVFNWRYILDGLKIISSPEVVWGIVSSDRPTLMRGTSDPSLLYVVMPIRNP